MNPYPLSLADDNDIIDEAMYFFKANVFFKQFEVKVSIHSLPPLPFNCLPLCLQLYDSVWLCMLGLCT